MEAHIQFEPETDLGSKSAIHARDGMVQIPGGTFRMGSDKHYPEEAPAHRAAAGDFWIDRHPITNRQFKEFVRATRHVTFAEIAPDPKDYPGALPHMLFAGSLVLTPPQHPVDLRDWSQWWTFLKGANWRHPYGPGNNIKGLEDHPVVHIAYSDAIHRRATSDFGASFGKELRNETNCNFPVFGPPRCFWPSHYTLHLHRCPEQARKPARPRSARQKRTPSASTPTSSSIRLSAWRYLASSSRTSSPARNFELRSSEQGESHEHQGAKRPQA